MVNVMAVVFIIIVGIVAIVIVGTAFAQESQLIRYEGDKHTIHDSKIPVLRDDGHNEYYLAFNPRNHTFTYGDNNEYIADPIHIGPWDVIPRNHYDNTTHKATPLNDDDIIDQERANIFMLRYLVNVTDTQAAQIVALQAWGAELEAHNDQLQYDVDKLKKKITKLEMHLKP